MSKCKDCGTTEKAKRHLVCLLCFMRMTEARKASYNVASTKEKQGSLRRWK